MRGALVAILASLATAGDAAAEAGVATGLAATADCRGLDMHAAARLTWVPADPPGEMQRVELNIHGDGFDEDVEHSIELRGNVNAFDWRRVHGSSTHYWRVLTRRGDAWTPSAVATFTGVECPAPVPMVPLPPAFEPKALPGGGR